MSSKKVESEFGTLAQTHAQLIDQIGSQVERSWARKGATRSSVLSDPPEPLTKEQFDAARKRLKASLDQIVTIDKRELQRLIDEVMWLKRRLHRVEDAIEPLVDALRRGGRA